jgi:crossover junction endodeoxyribonuclease RusA
VSAAPFHLVLRTPFPPSVNTYWRRVGNRTLLSKRAREYRAAAQEAILVQTTARQRKAWPERGPIEAYLRLYPRTLAGFDVDNYAKGILDAMEHAGVIENDTQVQRLTIEKFPKAPPGMAVLSLGAYQGPPE